MSKPLKGFIAYSHKDTEAKDKLRTRLAVMKQQNELITWHDGDLTAGARASQEDILKHLADSDLLLYIVSAESLDSENCNKELAEALRLDMRVIPIILESCDWLNHQLQDFEALPDKGNPINEWQPESRGWQNVVDGVRKAVDETRACASNAAEKDTLPEWAFQQGNFLMMLGETDMAIEAYSHAIDLKPEHANAYNNRGAAYLCKGELDLAIADFNVAVKLVPAVKLAPDVEMPYVNLGTAYSEKGNVDKAIWNFNTAIELNPSCVEGYNGRGIVYCNIGAVAKALADFNAAVELDPDDFVAYNNRGNVYNVKGEVDKAIGDYNTAIKLNSDYADAYNNRGNAYSSRGYFDRALKDYNTAIKLNPDFADAYYNRGVAYGKKREFESAIADYSKAIELNHNNAKAYCNRGVAYFFTGEFNLAIEDYTTAMGINPQDAPVHFYRALVWLYLQNWDKAKEDLVTAKRIGLDVSALVHSLYKSVADFERIIDVNLPEDIKATLTQR